MKNKPIDTTELVMKAFLAGFLFLLYNMFIVKMEFTIISVFLGLISGSLIFIGAYMITSWIKDKSMAWYLTPIVGGIVYTLYSYLRGFITEGLLLQGLTVAIILLVAQIIASTKWWERLTK